MKLPLPGPRDLFGVLERGAEQVETLLGLAPRLAALVDQAEVLLARLGPILDRVEAVATAAALEVVRVNEIAGQAQGEADRVGLLLDGLEPSLTRLQPTLQVLAETTDPAEVAALVAMVDHLPELTRRLEEDLLPVMATLSTVAPDLHGLLAASQELNEIIGKVPGFGRIKRRVEEEQDDDEAAERTD